MILKSFLKVALGCAVLLCGHHVIAQTLPSGIVLKDIAGGTFTMGSSTLQGNQDQKDAAVEHQVTLSAYALSEAEITNEQYVEFLNAALADGLIEVIIGTNPPLLNKKIIVGTALSSYEEKLLYQLDGTRVMKDHDDADFDGNEFTGEIEPENPLNIAYVGYNETSDMFYVKDPHNVDDFNWYELCNYQDYSDLPHQLNGVDLNDFDNWAGSGANYSDELEGWTEQNPSGATKLPNQAEVSTWPVTFVAWWGAKAFADYYNVSLPTEAQWEYAAKGGNNFEFAVHDGADLADANYNPAGAGIVAYHHVRAAISGTENPFGLYNLGGNAWEWIGDNYTQLGTDPVTDPFYENGTTERCWRGGSWNYHSATLQSAFRDSDDEARGNDHFGFRIASSAQSQGASELINSLEVFPNPSTSSFSVLTDMQILRVEICNTLGALVDESDSPFSLGGGLLPGVYTLRIYTSKGVEVKRVVKE